MEKDLTTGKITPQLIGFTIPLVLPDVLLVASGFSAFFQ